MMRIIALRFFDEEFDTISLAILRFLGAFFYLTQCFQVRGIASTFDFNALGWKKYEMQACYQRESSASIIETAFHNSERHELWPQNAESSARDIRQTFSTWL